MNSELIVFENTKSTVAEAYRILRTNIQFSNVDKNIKAICVTSSGPSEGKTTISCNLSQALVQSGKKVLLIDGDLRKPRVHKIFNISGRIGLSNLLTNQCSLEDSIQRLESGLMIIPSGIIPPNPSELINSNRMKELILTLREQYDWIIIDTPPIEVVTDSAIFSTLVDGTLLVIATGKTEIQNGKNAKKILNHVNAHILGVVMTMFPSTNISYGSYNYINEEFEKNTRKRKLFKFNSFIGR